MYHKQLKDELKSNISMDNVRQMKFEQLLNSLEQQDRQKIVRAETKKRIDDAMKVQKEFEAFLKGYGLSTGRKFEQDCEENPFDRLRRTFKENKNDYI